MNKPLVAGIVIGCVAVVGGLITVGVIPWRFGTSSSFPEPASPPPDSSSDYGEIVPPVPDSEPTSDSITEIGGLKAERYDNNDYGYTIFYPQNWSFTNFDSYTVRIMKPNSVTEIQISAVYATNDPLSEFVASMRHIYEDNMGYEIISRGDILEDDSAEACLDMYTYDYTSFDLPVAFMQETLYMKAKPYGWAIRVNCICDAVEWDIYKDLFYDVVTNFRLIYEEPLPEIDLTGYEPPLASVYHGSEWITLTQSEKQDIVQDALDKFEELRTHNTKPVDELVSMLDSIYSKGNKMDEVVGQTLWGLILGE